MERNHGHFQNVGHLFLFLLGKHGLPSLHPFHDGHILCHVNLVRRARERRNVAQRHEKSKHIGLGRQALGLGHSLDLLRSQGLTVRGQRPKGLVFDLALLTKAPKLCIKVGSGSESILQEL